MGGNSLTGIDLIARLRKTFNLETLASHILYEAPSVSALAQHIEQGHEKGQTHEPVKERLERGGKRRDSLKQRSTRHRTQERG